MSVIGLQEDTVDVKLVTSQCAVAWCTETDHQGADEHVSFHRSASVTQVVGECPELSYDGTEIVVAETSGSKVEMFMSRLDGIMPGNPYTGPTYISVEAGEGLMSPDEALILAGTIASLAREAAGLPAARTMTATEVAEVCGMGYDIGRKDAREVETYYSGFADGFETLLDLLPKWVRGWYVKRLAKTGIFERVNISRAAR